MRRGLPFLMRESVGEMFFFLMGRAIVAGAISWCCILAALGLLMPVGIMFFSKLHQVPDAMCWCSILAALGLHMNQLAYVGGGLAFVEV